MSCEQQGYLPQTPETLQWEAIDKDRVLAVISDHLISHLNDLASGIYDTLLPAEAISELFEYNFDHLQSLASNIMGDLPAEAVLARYYACINEQNDYVSKLVG